MALHSKAIIQNQRADKELPNEKKLKEFIITESLLHEMIKGLIYKKKEIKTMNNKMAIHTYLSAIESKKETKQ